MFPSLIRKLNTLLDCHIGSPIRESGDRAARLMRQSLLSSEMFQNYIALNPLLRSPTRYFSQNDEDGITLRLLERLKLPPSRFLELGVGNGLENNTLLLLSMKWTGGWIGGEEIAFNHQESRLTFLKDWITLQNCVDLAKRSLNGAALSEVKFVSVDLDGNDYHLVDALLGAGLRPDIFVVEYNSKFSPNAEFVMPYDEHHQWRGDDYFGASLASWNRLFDKSEYQLVACSLTGVNAFFVKQSTAALFDDIPKELDKLFIPGTYLPFPISGHPLSPRTVEHFIR